MYRAVCINMLFFVFFFFFNVELSIKVAIYSQKG